MKEELAELNERLKNMEEQRKQYVVEKEKLEKEMKEMTSQGCNNIEFFETKVKTA